MGLLSGIGAGLNAASQAAIGQQQGELQGSALMRAIQMQQYQIQKEQAETAQARDHAALFRREASKPQLGDGDPYNTAIAGEAGARIAGQTQPLVDQTNALAAPKANAEALKVSTTAQPEANAAALKAGAVLPMEKQLAAYKAQQEGDKDIRVSGATVGDKVAVAQQTGRIDQAAANHFTQQNKPLTDAVNAYAQAKAAFAEAKHGNPAALKSAILAFAGVADPKANLRQGVINMISQVDPSVRGNFDLAVDRLSSGRLPPQTLDNMEALVDRVGKMHRDLYEQRRQEITTRLPGTDRFIPSSDAMFTVPASATAPAQTSAPGTFTYNGVTYKAP